MEDQPSLERFSITLPGENIERFPVFIHEDRRRSLNVFGIII